ncbi:MAG: NAD(P)-dependent oxidoreductase, partial [Candidatus Rokubacteria bacterium]|nr:NAD(P)-dependent oxidoreductase [Candidatus Rokubacteria bacterium]
MDARVPRRILVTGATGFIGQAVVPALRARCPEAVLGGLARSERAAAALAARHLTPVRG